MIDVKTLEEIKAQLEMLKPTLRERFGVVTIGVFGSFSRREQTGKSDLDVLVVFSEDVSVWGFSSFCLENSG
jgi:predicted nucleotidyltransferase